MFFLLYHYNFCLKVIFFIEEIVVLLLIFIFSVEYGVQRLGIVVFVNFLGVMKNRNWERRIIEFLVQL